MDNALPRTWQFDETGELTMLWWLLYLTDLTRQSLGAEEQIAYSSAINCLASQPSQLDQTLYPGAINRYMDFAVIHINQTLSMHLVSLTSSYSSG